MSKHINIAFPFQDSADGYLFNLTQTTNDAIKADLMHLILTKKGERYYNGNFGTDLLRFIFEPNDGITHSDIEEEIKDVVSRYMPRLTITKVLIEDSTDNDYTAKVTVNYTVTEDVFSQSDFIIINV